MKVPSAPTRREAELFAQEHDFEYQYTIPGPLPEWRIYLDPDGAELTIISQGYGDKAAAQVKYTPPEAREALSAALDDADAARYTREGMDGW